ATKRSIQRRARRKLGLLPPPLWGRGGEGGDAARRPWRHLRKNRTTPTPNPSPQGGGERSESAASISVHQPRMNSLYTAAIGAAIQSAARPRSARITCAAL